MRTPWYLKKVDGYLFQSAAWTCFIIAVFISSYTITMNAEEISSLSTNATFESNYIWPWSVKDKKAALLNLATRAKSSPLFDAEIKYIEKETAGNRISQYNFTSSEKSAVINAIAQSSTR